jgi:hypothetical protein
MQKANLRIYNLTCTLYTYVATTLLNRTSFLYLFSITFGDDKSNLGSGRKAIFYASDISDCNIFQVSTGTT